MCGGSLLAHAGVIRCVRRVNQRLSQVPATCVTEVKHRVFETDMDTRMGLKYDGNMSHSPEETEVNVMAQTDQLGARQIDQHSTHVR